MTREVEALELTEDRGAQVLGIRGVLVQTGKFLPGDRAKVPAAPDDVLATIADLPKLLDAS